MAAQISLLLENWFEPPRVQGMHLSTLIQQVLSPAGTFIEGLVTVSMVRVLAQRLDLTMRQTQGQYQQASVSTHQERAVNYATQQKPRRQDFATDDDFGEAYALWMMRQSKVPKSTTTATVARATAPAVAPKPLTARFTARSEIERDTWNQHTKARFMRAKGAVQPFKK